MTFDLQSQIDATPAGGTLTLPPARYTVRQPVDLRKYGVGIVSANGLVISRPITLEGAGSVIDGSVYVTPGAAGSHVSGLCLTLDPAEPDTAVLGGLVVYADDVVMDRLTVFGCRSTGIAWESSCQGGTLSGSWVWGCGSHSVYLQNAGRLKTVSGCVIGSPIAGASSYSLHGYGKQGAVKNVLVKDTTLGGPLVAMESRAGVDQVTFDNCSFIHAGMVIGQGCGQNGTVLLSRCSAHQAHQFEFHNLTTLTLDRCSFDMTQGVLFRYDLGWTGPQHYLHATGCRLLSAPGGVGWYAWGADQPPGMFDGMMPVPTHAKPGWWRG